MIPIRDACIKGGVITIKDWATVSFINCHFDGCKVTVSGAYPEPVFVSGYFSDCTVTITEVVWDQFAFDNCIFSGRDTVVSGQIIAPINIDTFGSESLLPALGETDE